MKLEAVQDNNVELVTEILGDISSLKVKDDSAAELSRILQEPHFQVRCCVWGSKGVPRSSPGPETLTVKGQTNDLSSTPSYKVEININLKFGGFLQLL